MTITDSGATAATKSGAAFGAANPLSRPSSLPFEAPPFDRLADGAFKPAIEAAMKRQIAEIAAIDHDPAAPTFDNTIVALERSGVDLTRASRVFFNLTSSNTNDRLQAVKAEFAPKFAAHGDAINLDPRLFARVKRIREHRAAMHLDAVSDRLLERYYTQFVRSGALLDSDGKTRLKMLNEEEARLTTTFSDNILKEVTATAIVVDRREQLDGLPDGQITAAAEAATQRGLDGKWLIALQNTTVQSVLASLTDRALRERIFKASIARNTSGPNDNRAIVTRLAQLRAQRAKLLGYATWAEYVMADQMAGSPSAARDLLGAMAPVAARNARAEAAKMQALIDREHGGFVLEAWDWDFYAERVRLAEYDLDEASLKPYFELERVLVDGLFFAAHELYGLGFRERRDLPVYQPDVRVFEISGDDGRAFGLLYLDCYAHDGKNGGAWMSTFVDQTTLLGQRPVIINNLNVVKPAAGQHALLDYDEVTTMFHEFGHGLHGLMSRQKYP